MQAIRIRSHSEILPIAGMFFLMVLQAHAGSSNAENPVVRWNGIAVHAVREAKLAAPMAARALAIVHTCTYNAWAVYDEKALGTQFGGALRRPAIERTPANKERAISYAAYRALSDLLPANVESAYKPLMRQLGCDWGFRFNHPGISRSSPPRDARTLQPHPKRRETSSCRFT